MTKQLITETLLLSPYACWSVLLLSFSLVCVTSFPLVFGEILFFGRSEIGVSPSFRFFVLAPNFARPKKNSCQTPTEALATQVMHLSMLCPWGNERGGRGEAGKVCRFDRTALTGGEDFVRDSSGQQNI